MSIDAPASNNVENPVCNNTKTNVSDTSLEKEGVLPDTWSSYWYNGRIYTNDHLSGHGVGVYKMKGLGLTQVNYYAGGSNPQTQIARFK